MLKNDTVEIINKNYSNWGVFHFLPVNIYEKKIFLETRKFLGTIIFYKRMPISTLDS